MKILLVDDNLSVRLTTAAVLEEAGHELCEAGSLAEARERVRGERFHMVILDLHLGDGLGTELVPELRELLPPVAIVFMSGSAPADLTVGADLVLEKGMNPDELVRRLEALRRE